jgi:hypothetical protein
VDAAMSDNGTVARRVIDERLAERPKGALVLTSEAEAAALMELILGGSSVQAAAKTLGIERKRALGLYEEVLQSLSEYRARLGALVMEDQLQRIEMVLVNLEGKVVGGSVGASEVYLKALDQRARLLDLYPNGQAANGNAVNIQVNFNGVGDEPRVVQGKLVERVS